MPATDTAKNPTTHNPTTHGPKMFWEDIVVATPITYGAYEVTKDEIFAYARAYDPQHTTSTRRRPSCR